MAELALQQPPPGHFSYYDLAWTPVTHRPPPAAGEKPEAVTVQQAKIPWDRVRDFITGEEARCGLTAAITAAVFTSGRSKTAVPDWCGHTAGCHACKCGIHAVASGGGYSSLCCGNR